MPQGRQEPSDFQTTCRGKTQGLSDRRIIPADSNFWNSELDPNNRAEHITIVLMSQSYAQRCVQGVYQERGIRAEFTHGNGGIDRRKPRWCMRFKGGTLKNLAVRGC